MKKGTIGCISAAVVAYLLFTVALVIVKSYGLQSFQASPTASRDTPGFNSGDVGLLEDSSKEINQVRPASEPMGIPERHEFEEDTVTFIWPDEEPIENAAAPDIWVEEPQGDDSIELVAVATWFPGADDVNPPPPGTSYPITFYEPDGATEIGTAQLDEMGVPKNFRSISPPVKYHTPRISFLFRTGGMEFVKCNDVDLGDQTTGSEVGYDLEYINEIESRTLTGGEWTRVDSALLMWHNSRLLARFQFLTGEPEIVVLPKEAGSQSTAGDHLRVQWISEVPGEIDIESAVADPFSSTPKKRGRTPKHRKVLKKLKEEHGSDAHSFTIEPDEDPDDPEPARFVLRASSSTLLRKHTALLTETGLNWDWRHETQREKEGFFFASMQDPDPSAAEIRLIHFPRIVEMEWEIPVIPESPNPGPVENLFQITIPRLTLATTIKNPAKEFDVAEDNLIALLCVSTQTAWEHRNIWDDHPPENLPDDYSFRNVTPQDLLHWYRKNTKGDIVKFDEEDFVLYVNQEDESWWTKLKNRYPVLNRMFRFP